MAGIYNSEGNDGYRPILRMLKRNGVALNFTCAEMLDAEQPRSARCSPQQLLRQVARAAAEEGVPLAAENALARFDRQAYDTVMGNAFPPAASGVPPFVSFTYLRKGGGLFHPSNWHQARGWRGGRPLLAPHHHRLAQLTAPPFLPPPTAQFVRFARRLALLDDGEKDDGGDSLEHLYNVAGDAAMAYHHGHHHGGGGGAAKAR